MTRRELPEEEGPRHPLLFLFQLGMVLFLALLSVAGLGLVGLQLDWLAWTAGGPSVTAAGRTFFSQPVVWLSLLASALILAGLLRMLLSSASSRVRLSTRFSTFAQAVLSRLTRH